MLAEILQGREEAVAERWIKLVFERYPRETAQFLEVERDPFSNPVRRMLQDAAGPLVQALVGESAGSALAEGLAELMRLRGVQDMSAAEAVAIVPLLRDAVMEVAGAEVHAGGAGAVEELGRGIERLMLVSFDAFVLSRERLYEARLAERERHNASLLRRAQKVLAGSELRRVGDGCGKGDPEAGC